MQRRLLVFALAFAASHAWAQAHEHHAAETAFGRPGDPAKVDRTVNVEMRDPAEFVPARIEVKTGETILFVVRNAGKHEHEMVLGTMKELEAHYAEMKRNPHGMHHSALHMAVPAPGKSAVIVWQFTQPGEFYYGCLVQDHLELGMYGKIVVTGAPESGMHEHHDQGEHAMAGMYGPYAMSREASGTSWVPDASSHQGVDAMAGDWMTMTHGMVNLIYDDQGGPRGETKTFSTSMLMVMAQKAASGGTLGQPRTGIVASHLYATANSMTLRLRRLFTTLTRPRQ